MAPEDSHSKLELLVGCGLAAVGCIVGPPLLTSLLTGAGINLATSAVHDRSKLWLARRGELNHDIAHTCLDAVDDAFGMLKRQWERSFQPGLHRKDPQSAVLALDQFGLLRDDFRRMLDDSQRPVTTRRALDLIDGDPSVAQDLFERELRSRLYGHSDQLVSFLTHGLPEAWARCVIERLKSDSEAGTRAWRAVQMAIFTDMRKQMEHVSASAAHQRIRDHIDLQLKNLHTGIATPLSDRLAILETCSQAMITRLDSIDEKLDHIGGDTRTILNLVRELSGRVGDAVASAPVVERMDAAIVAKIREEAAQEASAQASYVLNRLQNGWYYDCEMTAPSALPSTSPCGVATWTTNSLPQRAYVDYWLTPRGTFALLLFHSVAPATASGAIRWACRAALDRGDGPFKSLSDANKAALLLGSSSRFVTAFLAEIEASGRMRAFSAGYGGLIAVKTSLDAPWVEIASNSFPLGIDDELTSEPEIEFQLEQGGWVLGMSDGLPEHSFAAGEEMLGHERAWAMYQAATVDTSPAGAIANMLLAVREVEARGLGVLDRVVLAALQFGKHLGSVVVRSPEAKIAVAQESRTPTLLLDSGSTRA